VRAEHERVGVGDVGDLGEARAQARERVRDEADHRARGAVRAVCGERLPDLDRAVVVGVASAAVAVEVHEPRHEPPPVDVDAGRGIRSFAVSRRQDGVALDEHPEIVGLAVGVEFAGVFEQRAHALSLGTVRAPRHHAATGR
jgi:hypothetical protein